MAGRIVAPSSFSTSGGSVSISLINAAMKSSEALIRCRNDTPIMVAVQISSEALTVPVAGGQQLLADIDWQVEAGGHSATVEVGQGTAFTVTAAEIVNVRARLRLANTFVAGTHDVRVNGTASPACSINPVPAYLSDSVSTGAGGAASTAITVPTFARRFSLLAATIGALTNVECTFRNAASNVTDDLYGGEWTVVPSLASTVVFSTPAAIGAVDLQVVWELHL